MCRGPCDEDPAGNGGRISVFGHVMFRNVILNRSCLGGERWEDLGLRSCDVQKVILNRSWLVIVFFVCFCVCRGASFFKYFLICACGIVFLSCTVWLLV